MIEITAEYLASQGLSTNFPKRFFAHVHKTDSCWIWVTGHSSNGYGLISYGGKNRRKIGAHRASWILHKGPIPDGLQVNHNCPGGDNRACVNPDHLWLGTQQQNVLDEYAKGRKPANSKLSPEDVILIRETYNNGKANQLELASHFGVCRQNVSMIAHGIRRIKYGGPITHSTAP